MLSFHILVFRLAIESIMLLWGPVVVCGAQWLCEGPGGCVRGPVVV